MLLLPLVNAVGLPQLEFNCPDRFVTAVTVMVQLLTPLGMDTPLKAIVSGLPCMTIELPLQPFEYVTDGAAPVNRS